MIEKDEIIRLAGDLARSDAGQRRAAAEALAEGDERALYPLIRALRDENAGVQDAAMRALISIGGEAAAYMTLPLLRENANLRNTALIILTAIGPVVVPLLKVLLSDRDEDVRKFALDLIGDIKTCDYPEELVRLLESDPNPNVRAAASRAIGLLNYREAVPALIAGLHDDEWVCFSVLEALSQFSAESSVEPIGNLLNNPSPALRYAAIEALGKIGSTRGSEILHAYLPKADDMEKSAVVKSLVEAGLAPSMAGVAETLMNMLAHGDWEDRLIAIRGLTDIKEERAVRAIIDLAGSLDPSDPVNEDRLVEVRDALLRFGCTKPLIEALKDPSIKYRGKAITVEIVTELGCADALPYVVPLLQSTSTHVVIAAADAVARLAGEGAAAILSPLKEHADEGVRERVQRLLETG
jgi:HEAT repeat protein